MPSPRSRAPRAIRRAAHRTRLGALLVALLVLVGNDGCDRAERNDATRGPTPAPAAVHASASRVPPGAEARDPALVARLAAALGARDPATPARTRHRETDGTPRWTNRLVTTASPYLQQHAHNPVDWYPWGEEAFAAARRLGRPILLSVGYSTCHWCHVMEEESFEDEEIAAALNARYVAIKVDREERPDVDGVYMAAVQSLTGGGGWPMTVWLTPEGEPFYAATYVPPRDGDRGTATGFLTMLDRIAEVYQRDPAAARTAAASLTEHLRGALAGPPPAADLPGPTVLDAAAARYRAAFDAEHGGVRGRQKFPSALPVRFLLRHARRTGDDATRAMAVTTLAAMADGGIHDQIGGGFHRYTVDPAWRVPHFEKMLYDNALLVLAYLEGWQATGRADFAAVARDTLAWMERDMTAPEGAFYAATDADSPAPDGTRVEGWYFTWTPADLEAALGPDATRLAIAYYGVTDAGDVDGRSVLRVARPLAEATASAGVDPTAAPVLLTNVRTALRAARDQRPPPHRDEKILAAWNGLAIAAFARAAIVLDEPAHATTAARAADFVLDHLRVDGRLRRSWKDGGAHHAAVLDDYAALTFGLLELYEATGELRWLEEAIALDAVVARHFADPAGGFFLTADDAETLLAREKPAHDGAEPSGNSLHAQNLLRLAALTGDQAYADRATATLRAFGGLLAAQPAALAEMLLALDWTSDTPKEIVIVTPADRAAAAPFLARLGSAFVPHRVLSVVPEDDVATHAARVPLVADKRVLRDAPTAYVCEHRTCDLPTTDPDAFARALARVKPRGPGREP